MDFFGDLDPLAAGGSPNTNTPPPASNGGADPSAAGARANDKGDASTPAKPPFAHLSPVRSPTGLPVLTDSHVALLVTALREAGTREARTALLQVSRGPAYLTCRHLRMILDALGSGSQGDEDERVAAVELYVSLLLDLERGYGAVVVGRGATEVERVGRIFRAWEDGVAERKRQHADKGKGGKGIFSAIKRSLLGNNSNNASGGAGGTGGRAQQGGGKPPSRTDALIDMDATVPQPNRPDGGSAAAPASHSLSHTSSVSSASTASTSSSMSSVAASASSSSSSSSSASSTHHLAPFMPVKDHLFAELRAHLAGADFGDKRRVLHTAARAHYFTCAQLRSLMDALDFAEDRVVAVQMISPRVLDRPSFFAVVASKVGDSQERAKVDEAWSASRPPALPSGVTAEAVLAAAGAESIIDLTSPAGAGSGSNPGAGLPSSSSAASSSSSSSSSASAAAFDPFGDLRARTDSTMSIEEAFGSGTPKGGATMGHKGGVSHQTGGGGGGGGGGVDSLLDAMVTPSGAQPLAPSIDAYAALRDRTASLPVGSEDVIGADAGGAGGGRSRVTSQAGMGTNSMQSPMDTHKFEDLVSTLQRSGFEDKTPHIRQAAMFNFFSAQQVASVMAVCDFESERLAAASLMGPRLIDPEMSFEIISRISDDAERAKIAAILAQFQ